MHCVHCRSMLFIVLLAEPATMSSTSVNSLLVRCVVSLIPVKSNVLLARDRSIDIGNIVYISPISIYRYCIRTLDISFSIYRYCIGDK